jgi:hypothetical protein
LLKLLLPHFSIHLLFVQFFLSEDFCNFKVHTIFSSIEMTTPI